MKYHVWTAVRAFAGLFIVSSCASVPLDGGFRGVQEQVETRSGAHIHWIQGKPEDREVVEQIQSMLSKKLSADEAVQVALLNNPSLQATFEDLGIAQADLVQAGLLKNPVFAARVRFPAQEGSNNTEFSVEQNFLDIILLPARKKLASEKFKQAGFNVGSAVLNLALEVRSTYYTLQGDHQLLSMQRTVVQAAESASELAEHQHMAGNISILDLSNQRAAFHEAKVRLMQSEAGIVAKRERLSSLMGLAEPDNIWKIKAVLPELPHQEPPSGALEDRAISQRLDLAAARQQTQILQRALSLARFGVVSPVTLGMNTEREADRPNLLGPTVEIGIPIFDRGQAASARIQSQLRQSKKQLEAMERQVRSEVRIHRSQLLAARARVEYYRDNIIPLHEQVVHLSQRHYNYMLKGVYALLQAKRNEIDVRSQYIEALTDYWVAQSELERAVGGRLSTLTRDDGTPMKNDESEIPPEEHHMQHDEPEKPPEEHHMQHDEPKKPPEEHHMQHDEPEKPPEEHHHHQGGKPR